MHFRPTALLLAPLVTLSLLGILTPTHAASAELQTPAASEQSGDIPMPSPSPSARELFDRTRDAIVQVRVLLASANEQATLGSGFVVRDGGSAGALVITNFHVISNLANQPANYRIELRGTNQRLVPAELLAIDVIHDLAVLRTRPAVDATPAPWQVLPLNVKPLPQGAPVYALGNPLELGFLIAEGLYNGSVEKRLYEQMLFSGSLNAGMSGGPAINQSAQVVGVNVATRRDGEQLSFLVPARYAQALLARADDAPVPADWHPEIGRQLLAHQATIFSKFETREASGKGTAAAGMASQQLAGKSVPTLDGKLTRCWAQGRNQDKARYQKDDLQCSLREQVFAGSGVYSGGLHLSHSLIRNDRLATPQFIALFNKSATHWGGNGANSVRARNQCHDDYVKGRQLVYRVAICVQAYRKYEGLFDYHLSAHQVDSTREHLASELRITGMSFNNAQALSRQFLERLP